MTDRDGAESPSKPKTKSTPARRMKADEVRAALLDAGRKVLVEKGVAPGLDRVTLEDVIERAAVPRSTAYNVFRGPGGPLEVFRAALLAELDTRIDSEQTTAAVMKLVDAHAEDLASEDAGVLAAVLREVIRVGLKVNAEATCQSLEWHLGISAVAALGATPLATGELLDIVHAMSKDNTESCLPLFSDMLDLFGLRVRPPMTLEHFGSLVTSTLAGIALHHNLDPRLQSVERPTGPDGSIQQWSAAAIAFEGLVLACVEADPRMKLSADIGSWATHLASPADDD